MKTIKTISILGCGWLGLPLGESLLNAGYHIKGSTTKKEKSFFLYDKGIEPYILSFNPELKGRLSQDFFKTNSIIVNIPPSFPKNGDGSDFLLRIENIIKTIKLANIKFVIFTSSTSVYGNTDEEITETTPLNPITARAKALVEAEKMFIAEKKLKTTILRIGGMVGPNRHPGRFFSFEKKQSGAQTPVNLIHQEDIINIIVELYRLERWGGVYNLTSDKHPTRRQFYTFATLALEKPPAIFTKEGSFPNKIVSNKKIKRVLRYKMKYPDLEKIYCEER